LDGLADVVGGVPVEENMLVRCCWGVMEDGGAHLMVSIAVVGLGLVLTEESLD